MEELIKKAVSSSNKISKNSLIEKQIEGLRIFLEEVCGMGKEPSWFENSYSE